jgi:hypothetical protein
MRFKSFKMFEWGDPWDHHPNAPWNQPDDPEPTREIDWIEYAKNKDRIKFDLLATDSVELGILKEKETGLYYAIYIGGDEIEDYRQKVKWVTGRDGDGDPEYEEETQEIDDTAIIALASDTLQEEENVGSGLQPWEEGKILCVINTELLEEIKDTWKRNSQILQTLQKIEKEVEDQRGKIAAKKFKF